MYKSKKIVAAILCLMMIFSMMPAMALADSQEPSATTPTQVSSKTNQSTDGNLNLTKTLYYDSASHTYSIELESYARGHVQVTQKAAPTDFVIVLDQSGSMKEYVEIGNGITDLDKLDKELGQEAGFYRGHFSGYGDYNLRYNAQEGYWEYDKVFGGWTEIGSNRYTISDIKISKTNAAKVAVKNFINSVAAEKADSGNDHRIAVVGFASDSEVLNPLVAADDADLKKVIEKFKTNGATRVDLGVKEAETIFQNEKDADAAAYAKRGHVVIVISDGSPTSTNGFENKVANSAISAAKDLKDNLKAKIYTVGLNLDENDRNYRTIERFMNYLSSNYPKAVDMNTPGEKVSDKYYNLVTSSAALNDLFEQISVEGVQTDVTLDEKSEIVDVINPEIFVTDEVTADQVKVYTAPWNGTSFDEKTPYSDYTLSVDNATVKVTNFDYVVNAVADGVRGGNKLIIRIDGLKVKDNVLADADEGADSKVFTSNVGGAKIYADADESNAVLSVDSPTIEGVPVDINYYYDNVKKGDETVNKFSVPGSKIIATHIDNNYAIPKISSKPDWKMGEAIEPFTSSGNKSIVIERKDNNAPQDIDIYLIPAVDPNEINITYKQPEGVSGAKYDTKGNKNTDHVVLDRTDSNFSSWATPDGTEFKCWLDVTPEEGVIGAGSTFASGDSHKFTRDTILEAVYEGTLSVTYKQPQSEGYTGSEVTIDKLAAGNYTLLSDMAVSGQAATPWTHPDNVEFIGWALESDANKALINHYDLTVANAANAVFVAQYAVQTATVKYKQPDGAIGSEVTIDNAPVGVMKYKLLTWTAVSEKATDWEEPEGYEFEYWLDADTQDDFAAEENITLTANETRTFIAHYKKIQAATVTYKQPDGVDGAEVVYENLPTGHYNLATWETICAKDTTWAAPAGKQFKEWKEIGGTDANYNEGAQVTLADEERRVFEAVYEDIPATKVTVTYKQSSGVDGTDLVLENIEVNSAYDVLTWDEVAEEVAAKDGSTAWKAPDNMRFAGWKLEGNEDTQLVTSPYNLAESTVFVAVYEEIPVEKFTLRVHYHQHGDGRIEGYEGDYVEITADGTLSDGATITLATFADVFAKAQKDHEQFPDWSKAWTVPANMKFTGWSLENDRTLLLGGSEYVVDMDILTGGGDNVYYLDLWANYSKKGSTTVFYNLDFVTNGGNEIASITRSGGTIVYLDEYVPTRKGYSFKGWYTDEQLTNKVTSVTLTENMKVYAKWSAKTVDEDGTPSDLNSKDHIKYVVGYPDGYVRPNNFVTRAETASMLYRLLTDERRAEVRTFTNKFSDVDMKTWYVEPASSMYKGGYIAGYADGTFGGDRNITRAEFVSMLVRFLGEDQGSMSFTDVPQTHWAAKDIAIAASQGWIAGYSDGTFKPNQPIIRAEAMSIINRVLNRGVNEKSTITGYKIWPDNYSNAWYYYDVIEATNAHDYTGARPSENWSNVR